MCTTIPTRRCAVGHGVLDHEAQLSTRPATKERSHRLAATEDRRTREDAATHRTPLSPDLAVVFRPLGLDDVGQHESGRDELAYPVADRPVLLHVGRRARRVILDVR